MTDTLQLATRNGPRPETGPVLPHCGQRPAQCSRTSCSVRTHRSFCKRNSVTWRAKRGRDADGLQLLSVHRAVGHRSRLTDSRSAARPDPRSTAGDHSSSRRPRLRPQVCRRDSQRSPGDLARRARLPGRDQSDRPPAGAEQCLSGIAACINSRGWLIGSAPARRLPSEASVKGANPSCAEHADRWSLENGSDDRF